MKKYQSEALMVIHQDAEGLHSLGIISDAEMKKFDEDCLDNKSKTAHTTDKIPEKENITA